MKIIIPAISILAITLAIGRWSGITIDRQTRDVVAIAGIHPLSGVLSSLGILLWCSAASVSMFVALCIRENLARHVFYFALSSALLSGWLMLDDLFLIHEDLANRYLGIGEKSVLAALGTFVFAYLVAFSRTILRTNYSNLAIAFVFLAASVVIDVLLEKWVERLGPWTVFVEDGLKWIGICFWCAYHAATARQLLAESCLASTRAATNRAGP